MAVDFIHLRDTNMASLADASRAWIALARSLDRGQNEYLTGVMAGVRNAGWSGEAADAAHRQLVATNQLLHLAVVEATSVASILDSAHTMFTGAQRKLLAAVAAANQVGLSVSDTGAVSAPPPATAADRHDPSYAQVMAQNVATAEADIRAALKAANEADGRVRDALGTVLFDSESVFSGGDKHPVVDAAQAAKTAADLAGFAPGGIPPKDIAKDPVAVNKWWKSLTPEQQTLIVNAYPDKIGDLNGIPSAARDQANRVSLDQRILDLQGQDNSGIAPDISKVRDELKNARSLVDVLTSPNANIAGPPLLLHYSLDGQNMKGQAVIALGDPDHAAHNALMVPGSNTDMQGLWSNVREASHLQAQMNAVGGAGGNSTIVWFGYSAPHLPGNGGVDTWGQAATPGAANEGAPKLNAFVDGLRATETVPGTTITAIGHSYGNAVVGAAAVSGGLHVDRIVAVAAPGLMVHQASELPVPVYVLHHDPKDGISTFANESLGYDPNTAAFGAHMVASGGATDHNHYWLPGSQALDNQARIAVGLPPQGSAPYEHAAHGPIDPLAPFRAVIPSDPFDPDWHWTPPLPLP
jgi:hypothetical protein